MSRSPRIRVHAQVLVAVAALFLLSSSAARRNGTTAQAEARPHTLHSVERDAQAPRSLLAGFDLAAPPARRSHLPAHLREISGLAVDARGRVFAHADEVGVVTEVVACGDSIGPSLRLGNPTVADDFEGIVAIGSRLVLITSNGKLYGADNTPNAGVVQFNIVETGFGEVCEIEGLAWNEAEEVLIAGCKERRGGGRRSRGSGGADSIEFLKWSTAQAKAAGVITLPLQDISQRTGQRRFRSSAVEWSPSTSTYIALAGPERAILEFTPEGRVVAASRLERSLHRQPEGLAILGDSVLMIADEGGNGQATMSCYHRRK